MNEKEAIEILNDFDKQVVVKSNAAFQTQKAIDACKVATIAMEFRSGKEPYLWGDGYSDGQLVYDMWDCPNCGTSYEIDEKPNFCPECGQKLRWDGIE